MKRVLLAVVSTVASLVMLLSFKTHGLSAAATPPAAISTTGTSGSAGSHTTAKHTGNRAKTYAGDTAMTSYGPIQVQITVKGGAVASARATTYPMSTPQDAQINSYAIPQLNSEATAAGSANIDMVSGATYTSEGYLSSLQSALNKAGL